MNKKNLEMVENKGVFSIIKQWLRGLFLKKNSKINESSYSNLEFEKQNDIPEPVIENEKIHTEQIKYEFSTSTVSKQKIEKIKMDLDNGKIGVEELYQLSDEELDELTKLYDNQINDTVSKLNEVQISIDGYNRKIAKMQSINQ